MKDDDTISINTKRTIKDAIREALPQTCWRQSKTTLKTSVGARTPVTTGLSSASGVN